MDYSEKGIEIIEAARKLFSENGFKAVTTKAIAENANVNEVTIFRIFQNKTKLFDEVLNYIVSKPDISKYISPDENNLENYLLGIGNLIHTVFKENFDVFKIELLERKMLSSNNRISKFPNQLKQKLKEFLINNCGKENVEAEIFAVSFLAAVHGLCMNIYFLKTFEPTPNFKSCLKFLINKYI